MDQIVSPEALEVFRIFRPAAVAKHEEALERQMRFAHYTSAEAAMKIITSGEFWLRRSSLMNDFLEVQHGLDCLVPAYRSPAGERLKETLNSLFPGFSERLEAHFNGWIPRFQSETYIASVSEHMSDEDDLGRLSMWRAYGGKAGVAIVLNGGPFLRPSDALKAYTNPVAYKTIEQFQADFDQASENICSSKDVITKWGDSYVYNQLFDTFRSSILCTKHPGFHEEREWRVIYSPTYEYSDRVGTDVCCVAGIPQLVHKIRMQNYPEDGFYGAEINEVVERIIIGPSDQPRVLYDAFVKLLENAGVENAFEKVRVSDIPLKQQT